MTSALLLALQVSGKCDKAVCADLGIDKAQWSRIKARQMHFPHDKLEAFCDVVGNDIVLEWFAYRRGRGTHLLPTHHQRAMRERDAEIEQLRTKLAHFEEFLGKVGK